MHDTVPAEHPGILVAVYVRRRCISVASRGQIYRLEALCTGRAIRRGQDGIRSPIESSVRAEPSGRVLARVPHLVAVSGIRVFLCEQNLPWGI